MNFVKIFIDNPEKAEDLFRNSTFNEHFTHVIVNAVAININKTIYNTIHVDSSIYGENNEVMSIDVVSKPIKDEKPSNTLKSHIKKCHKFKAYLIIFDHYIWDKDTAAELDWKYKESLANIFSFTQIKKIDTPFTNFCYIGLRINDKTEEIILHTRIDTSEEKKQIPENWFNEYVTNTWDLIIKRKPRDSDERNRLIHALRKMKYFWMPEEISKKIKELTEHKK